MAVKVYGVRIEEDVIQDFKVAVDSLPISLKSSSLIESYMSKTSRDIKRYNSGETTVLKLTIDGNDWIFHKKDGKDNILLNGTFSEVEHNEY